MNCFIDGINLIRIESTDYINHITIEGYDVTWYKNEDKNQYFKTNKPLELHQIDRLDIDGSVYPLHIGLVTLTDDFDEAYRYDGSLGAIYQKTHTTFRVFSPVAKEMFVVVDGKSYEMTYQKPIWTCEVKGDLHLKTYHYDVKLVDTFKSVKDPYAKAESSKGTHVFDFNQSLQLDASPITLKNYVDAVIYEGHVRDMTINLDVKHPGLYDGLVEPSKFLKGSVLEYIKDLGMTHLQLLPVFDFDDVFDEDKKLKYNWGYNPSLYFAVEGWYSKKPEDPADRINGLKNIVKCAHGLGLGVNMDVVYNHVFNHHTFPYDDLVPGYFFRHDQNNKMTDGSFCGNEVESRHYMVRKLIVDSLVHFADIYKMDGFRFDLMGLLDIKTMKDIEKAVRKINPSIMLYGEGWNMQTVIKEKHRANMNNQKQFQTYAHFNDFYRNIMKGEMHGEGLGYTMGNAELTKKAMNAIVGSPHMFESPNQSINYVECHDNHTFYDQMVIAHGLYLPDFKVTQDFANHLIAISQGMPFYHAGQEFYRTKKGVENSYNSPDDINQITWRIREASVSKLKDLLKLRKAHDLYRQTDYNNSVTITKDQKMVIYTLENEQEKLVHYIKNYFELEKLPLNGGTMVFPSQKAICEKDHIYIDQPGIYIVHTKK